MQAVAMHLCRNMGPVVQSPISANPGLTQLVFIKSYSRIVYHRAK